MRSTIPQFLAVRLCDVLAEHHNEWTQGRDLSHSDALGPL